MRMALRTRIAIGAALCVATACIGMSALAYIVFDRAFSAELDRSLVREASRMIREAKTGTWDPFIGGDCVWESSPACAKIIGHRNNTSPLPPTDNVNTHSPLPTTNDALAVAAGQLPRASDRATVHGRELHMLTLPLDDGRAIEVAVPTASGDRNLTTVRHLLLVACAGAILLACLLGYLIARAGLRPLRHISATTRRIAASGDPSHRITVNGADELATMSQDFNTMLAALDTALTTQRRFVADASHELRTPLTVLRTDTELLTTAENIPTAQRNAILHRIHAQTGELTQLVNNLLDLAHDEHQTLHHEGIRLDELVTAAITSTAPRYPNIEFQTTLEPTPTHGDPAQLQRAIANLLDNAAKFSPPNAAVSVHLKDNCLYITDNGPGIPDHDRPHVFERFYRADNARTTTGSGLGLAIVAHIAHQHHATIFITNPQHSGTTVELRFPPTNYELRSPATTDLPR